jgi:rubrerythrin
MGIVFTADEVFEIAEKLEQNGAQFYRDAAGKVTDPQERETLLRLAQMEDEHGKTFAELRKGLTAEESKTEPDSKTDLEEEQGALQYLQSWADTRIFFQRKIDLTSIEEVLKEAIRAEEDSVIFYLGMKDVVPESMGKNRIDNIIREEMAHAKLLSGKLLALKTKK